MFPFFQPTMVVNQACTQEIFRKEEVSRNKFISRNISATTNKEKVLWEKIWDFFRIGSPKTAFLMRNIPIDPLNLGIFLNKQSHSFQFPKKSRVGLPLLPGSSCLLIHFKIQTSASKKYPRSFQYIWFLFWVEGEIQYSEPRKTNFVNTLMKV